MVNRVSNSTSYFFNGQNELKVIYFKVKQSIYENIYFKNN